MRSYFWEHGGPIAGVPEPELVLNHVFKEHSLVPILNHLSLLEVVFDIFLVHFFGLNHLGLHVDDPVHYLLVLSIDSLRLSLLTYVVPRLRRSSLDLDILLVHVAVLPC